MDHIRLKPMPLKSGREPTAVTKQSIKELLAEAGVTTSDDLLMPAAPPEPEVSTEDARVFDHTQLMPMIGKSGREPTAITHKSIKELLAEEGVDINDMPHLQSPEPELEAQPEPQTPMPEPAAEQRPAPKPNPFEHVKLAEAVEEEKPRSLLGRLIGG